MRKTRAHKASEAVYVAAHHAYPASRKHDAKYRATAASKLLASTHTATHISALSAKASEMLALGHIQVQIVQMCRHVINHRPG